MKNILILGAGKSSTVLIKYLSNLSEKFNLKIKVAALDVSYFFSNPLNNVLPIELLYYLPIMLQEEDHHLL